MTGFNPARDTTGFPTTQPDTSQDNPAGHPSQDYPAMITQPGLPRTGRPGQASPMAVRPGQARLDKARQGQVQLG